MPDSKDQDRRKLAQLHVQLSELRERQSVIEARFTKAIWTDRQYDELDYNQSERLRKADLTLKLADDAEYRELRNTIRNLEGERMELQDTELDFSDDDL